MEFTQSESDVELQTILQHLAEGWVYLRAYQVIPDPTVEDIAEAIEAQIETVRRQGAEQGVDQQEIDLVTGPLEAQVPDSAFIHERAGALISPAQVARLAEMGIVFDALEDDDDFDLDIDDLGDDSGLPEVTLD